MARGAMSRDPRPREFGGDDPARIQARINYLKKLRPRDPQIRALETRLAQLNPTGGTPDAGQTPVTFDQLNTGANEAMGDLFGQIRDQGAFNPGSFDELQKEAYDRAMGEFSRTTDPMFKKQEEDFQQMAAERGWDPGSRAFSQYHQQNVLDPQSNARQGAMNNAWQQGLAAQQQAFGQAAQQYQMPYANMGAFTPFYQGQFAGNQAQLDREFQKRMAAIQQRYALEQIKATPRGGGGGGALSMADRLALMNQEFYNNAALMGMQNGMGGPTGNPMGSGFASGIGAGAALGIGSLLK